MKIGIIREGKTPPDKRVPFSPEQCLKLKELKDVELFVQPSPIRCFENQQYADLGITLKEDLSDCDVLFGVKEVKIKDLLAGKKYFFFSHTIKEQPYNKELMKALINKNIQMIDYECLQNEKGQRLLGFGRFAGIVGSYNALLAYGLRSKSFELKPAHECEDLVEIKQELQKIKLGSCKIILTGGGRVAQGAVELLLWAGIKEVKPEDFIAYKESEACFSRLDCEHYYELPGQSFDYGHFYQHSEQYEVNFLPYLKQSEIFISCHYWDNKSKILFQMEDLKSTDWKTEVIADITCDIQGSVPSTIRPSTIVDPIYGIDKTTGKEGNSFDSSSLTVMAVDNLPCELPKDASADFGNNLLELIIPELLKKDSSILKNASICKNGELTNKYNYLANYAS